MDKKKAVTYGLMAIGAIIGALGGAATASEIPEHIEKVKGAIGSPKEDTPGTE